ncbi:MAG: type II secretion system protein GspC [Myxococcota bacterium]
MLDGYFKSYFWTFVVAAVMAGGYLTAKVTNVFVGRALQPPVTSLYSARGPVRRSIRATPESSRDADAFLERNLFDAEREDLRPVEPSAAELAAQAAADERDEGAIDAGACNPDRCQASSVPANLLATMWFGDAETSWAVFEATAGGDVTVVAPGEKLLDQATVTAVFRRQVCVSRSGSCEIFTLDQAAKKVTTPQIAAAPKPEPSGPDIGEGVRKLGDKAYEIEKSEIDNVLSNLNQIARQARIVPSFKNGKSNGFKLFSIRPNSLYSKIGIQNGDIVQKINGYEINSPDKALEIYSKLKDADSITVDLVRRGKPQTMNYSIR